MTVILGRGVFELELEEEEEEEGKDWNGSRWLKWMTVSGDGRKDPRVLVLGPEKKG